MKNVMMVFMAGFMLISLNVYAQDDVSIGSDGNVTTGVSNTYANFEVTGASAEHAIMGTTSGTGAEGVIGFHSGSNHIGSLGSDQAGASGEDTTSGNYGKLGTELYGVYGHSTGWAGYFEGNARITGNLTVDGTFTGNETDPQVGILINGNWCASNGGQVICDQGTPVLNETDPTVNSLGKATLSCASGETAKWNGSNWACAVDIDTDTNYSAGTGLNLSGTSFNVDVPLVLIGDSNGGILEVTNNLDGGSGVIAYFNNSNGNAVLATAVGPNSNGAKGTSDGTDGRGVRGSAIGIGSYGGHFEGGSRGVYGKADASDAMGVYGESSSGTAGYFTSSSGTAGYFTSASGYGGYIISTSGYGLLVENGNVGIGTTNPVSALQVNGYMQLALTTDEPPSADCDETAERGRMKVDNVNGVLYICVDSGWVSR